MDFLRTFARAPRRLGKQWKLYRGYRAFCAQYRSFRQTLHPEKKGEVLLLSFTDFAPRLILEGIIAKAFACRGYAPIVLTSKRYRWGARYFRFFGVERILFLEDIEESGGHLLTNLDVVALLRAHNSLGSLFAYTWEGIAIGRHILSSVVRQLLQGNLSFSDPAAQALLRRFMPEALRAGAAAKHLFRTFRPEAVLFLEKGYVPYGPIFDAALENGLNTIQYFHGHRSDLLVMKRFRRENRFQHPFSLSRESWERVRRLPWSAGEEEHFMAELRRSYEEGTWMNRKFLLQGKRLKSSVEVRTQLHLDPEKKTAVIFSHVLWDATFFFGDNLFQDYEQWLIATVRVAMENTHVNWIIKLHPDYAWKMKQLGKHAAPRDIFALRGSVGELPAHISIVLPDTDISTYSFFGMTDYCITVRGTIGIEAPCFGIPVLTAGTGRYSGLGFTNDSKTPGEYLAKLRHIEDIPPLTGEEITLARKHAHALFALRPLPFTTCEIAPLKITCVRKGGSLPFDHEAVIRVRSLEELQHAPDMSAFLDWVLHSRDEDYLHLPRA